MLPLSKTTSAFNKAEKVILSDKQLQYTSCWLTPVLTKGPYYFNTNLIRQDITEGKPGMPLHMIFTVIDFDCNQWAIGSWDLLSFLLPAWVDKLERISKEPIAEGP